MDIRTEQEAEILSRVDIFHALGRQELDFIAENSSYLELAPGQTLFEEGSAGDCLYVVVSGAINVEKSSPEGRSARIAQFISGDFFGELDMLSNGKRSASALAESGTRLLRFPRPGEEIDDVMAGHPATAAKVLRSMLAVIAARTRRVNALVKENSPMLQALKRQVYGDKLSGLNNRSWLEETLPALCVPGGEHLALIMFKPDNFKEINDIFGHEAGDRTIILMACELRAFCLELEEGRAKPFRFAGNELGLLVSPMRREAALALCIGLNERLRALDLRAVLSPATETEKPPSLSLSFGIGLYPLHAARAQALIDAVQELPFRARALGGNRILFLGEEL